MPKSFSSWKVLEHSELEQLTENLWVVEGALPNMPLKRRMTVVRRDDGSLLLHNPIALGDRYMSELDRLGPVRMLIVPNGLHRLDAPAFKTRYPDARVVCPRGSRKKVEEVVTVDQTYNEVEADQTVELEHIEGVRHGEGVMKVHSSDGVTLIVNDLIFNLRPMAGLFGLIYGRLLRNAGGPRITTLTRLTLIKRKAAVKSQLLRLAEIDDLARLVMSHGDPILEEVPRVLRQLASSL